MAKRPASTSPFAHLAKANAEDDDDKNKSKAVAEGEEDDEDGEEEEGEDKDAKSKRARSKKAKADGDGSGDDDGDTEDEEDEKDDQAKAARSRERARCAAIFASPAAARNLPAAAHLAFNTSMPRSQAVGLLGTLAPTETAQAATASEGSKTLRDRMQDSPFAGIKTEHSRAQAPARPGVGLLAAQNIRQGGQ